MDTTFINLSTEPAAVYSSETGGSYRMKGKLGDDTARAIYFLQAGEIVDPPASTFVLELKASGQYQSDALVRIVDFTEATDGDGKKYLSYAPAWNSQAVLDVLEPGGARQPRRLFAMAELTWKTAENQVGSSASFEAVILNDVVKEFTSPAIPLPEAPWPTSNVDTYNGAALPGFGGGSLNEALEHLGARMGEVMDMTGAIVDVVHSALIEPNVKVVNIRGSADITLSFALLMEGQVVVVNHLGFGYVTLVGSSGVILTPASGKRLAVDGYGAQVVVAASSATAADVSGGLQVSDDVYDLAEPDIDLDSSVNFQTRPASSGDVYSVNPRKGSSLIERLQPDAEAINASNFTRLVDVADWDAPLFDTRKHGVNTGTYSGLEMVLKNPITGPFTILFVGVSRYANVRKHVSHRIAGVDSPLIGAGGAYAAPNDDKYQWLINSTDGNLGSYVIGNVVPPAGYDALEAPPSPMIVGGVFDGASSELWVNGVLMKSGTISENILNEIIVGGAASPLCRRLLVWKSNQTANLTSITAALLNQHSNISSYVA